MKKEELEKFKMAKKPDDCSRFEYCSAPICPLDADKGLRVAYRGERTCFFLRQDKKDDLSSL